MQGTLAGFLTTGWKSEGWLVLHWGRVSGHSLHPEPELPSRGRLPEKTPAKRSWKAGGCGSDLFFRRSHRSLGQPGAGAPGSIHLEGPGAAATLRRLPS